MDTLFQDLRFGLRTLRKRPLFALVAVGTLGLGIGAATAIFSAVEGILLRPPPFHEPKELMSVWQTFPEWRDEPMLADGWDWISLSYPGYERWRKGQTHFQEVAIHGATMRDFSGRGDPTRLWVGIASSSLFPVLGVQPFLGRAFHPEEDTQGGPRVALLSHAFWVERFGGDPGVLGSTLTLNQDPFTVVGVLPPEFQLPGLGSRGSPGEKPVWIPVGADGSPRADNAHSYEAIGRLKPGATLQQALPETRNLIRAPGEEPEHSVRVVPWGELATEGLRLPLLLLLAASSTLLLIACGNVANLLLGEAAGRRHEMATRRAVGAGARRLARQLITESVMLGLAGSLLGVAIAVAGTRVLLGAAPSLPQVELAQVNIPVLLFGVGLGLLTGLLFGIAPAWDLARRNSGNTLARGWRGGSRERGFLQQAVISVELALTVVLLVSGTLLGRSLSRLLAVDPGFEQDRIAMVRVHFPAYRYADESDRAAQAERIRERLESIPGVLAASGTSSLPFYSTPGALSYGIEGQEMPEEISPHASLRTVLPGFFQTMGIRVLEGRALSDTDRLGTTPVAVISETMARRHWPDESPIGARILFGDTLEVVGVAADVVHQSLDAEPLATLYIPFLREAGTSINFVVRSSGDPVPLFQAFRQAVWEIDSEAPISRVATLPSLIRDSARTEWFRALLMGAFALCAAVLAGAGVFGVTARNVAQRTKEMGIRKALGARPGSLVGLALSGTARVGLAGVGLGVPAALLAGRLLSGFLFGVEAWDPPTYTAAAGGLLLLSLFASYLPARRAGNVPPSEVLRQE
jgi:putative ABC transport system permease protein